MYFRFPLNLKTIPCKFQKFGLILEFGGQAFRIDCVRILEEFMYSSYSSPLTDNHVSIRNAAYWEWGHNDIQIRGNMFNINSQRAAFNLQTQNLKDKGSLDIKSSWAMLFQPLAQGWIKMLYLIGPDGLVIWGCINFWNMMWITKVHVLRYRIKP